MPSRRRGRGRWRSAAIMAPMSADGWGRRIVAYLVAVAVPAAAVPGLLLMEGITARAAAPVLLLVVLLLE